MQRPTTIVNCRHQRHKQDERSVESFVVLITNAYERVVAAVVKPTAVAAVPSTTTQPVPSKPGERRENQNHYFASKRESMYVVISDPVHSCGPTIFRSTRPFRSITYVSGYIVVPYNKGICFEVSR